MPVTPQPQAAMHRTILQRRRTAASLPLFTPRGPSLEAYRFLEGIRELGATAPHESNRIELLTDSIRFE
ncbi:hypothetical protein N7490_006680 [Penicillium lividum]|nr:hypothetical protein N7490_006680 [Penicillium lividum]